MREGRVHHSQASSVTGRSRVASCSRSSKASQFSVLSETAKLALRKLLWLQKFLYHDCKEVDHSHKKDFVWNTKKNCLN